MVIQRIQTLFLLVAVAALSMTLFFPFGFACLQNGTPVGIEPCSFPWYLGFNAVADLLLIISIFLFKKLSVQLKTTLIGGLMVAASVIWWFFISTEIAAYPNWLNLGLLILADIFTFLALRAMQKDRRLLRSYDRLR